MDVTKKQERQDLSPEMSKLFDLAYADVYGQYSFARLSDMCECYYSDSGYWYFGVNDLIDGNTYCLKVYDTGDIEFYIEYLNMNYDYLHINLYPLYKHLILSGYEFNQ